MKKLIIIPFVLLSFGSFSQINPASVLAGHWRHVDSKWIREGKEEKHELFFKDLYIYENGSFRYKRRPNKMDPKWTRTDSVISLSYPGFKNSEQKLIIRKLTDNELILLNEGYKVQAFDFYKR